MVSISLFTITLTNTWTKLQSFCSMTSQKNSRATSLPYEPWEIDSNNLSIYKPIKVVIYISNIIKKGQWPMEVGSTICRMGTTIFVGVMDACGLCCYACMVLRNLFQAYGHSQEREQCWVREMKDIDKQQWPISDDPRVHMENVSKWINAWKWTPSTDL